MESVRLESVFLLKQFVSTTNLFLNFLGGCRFLADNLLFFQAVDRELEFAREHGGLIRTFMVAPDEFKAHHNSINQIAFLDERRVVSCSTDKSIRLWD